MNNKAYQKEHYLKNRDFYLQKMRDYKIKNKDRILAYKKLQRDQNQEAIREYRKQWRLKHKKRLKEYRKAYRQKYLQNPENKLITSFRGQIKRALFGSYKSGIWRSLLGCSVEACRNHLESQFKLGMSWDNYGDWHIDHIKPISSFQSEHLKDAFHYTNLQPLWAIDNLRKGSKIEK